MSVPSTFIPIDDVLFLSRSVRNLGYIGAPRFVAFWWDDVDDRLMWADSDELSISGLADDACWWSQIRPQLSEFYLGSAGCQARQILIWDRFFDTLWIAYRTEGLEFLTGTGREQPWEACS